MDENDKQINKKTNIKTIRTYMSDMADTVRSNEISVIKVALAEQNKRAREDLYREAEGSSSKKIFWFIGGLVLIGVAIYGLSFLIKQKTILDTPQQIAREESIISYDEIIEINLIGDENLNDKLLEAKKIATTLNKKNLVKFISIKKDTDGVYENISTNDLFRAMDLSAPTSLIRSLSDRYMIGTYVKNSGENRETPETGDDLFIIFQTTNYSQTYAEMLEWENNIAGDLLFLFNLSSTENKLDIVSRKFKDIIINNRDSRVLFNEKDEPVLYYTFIDNKNLIITRNKEALFEIEARLRIKNIKPL